jgi:hypothetical protein
VAASVRLESGGAPVPMRKVKDIEIEVLTRPGRYKQVADNLQVKEVWVGDGERRKRYVLCLNPQEAERERQHRAQLLRELDAELALLDNRAEDHPKAACALLASPAVFRAQANAGVAARRTWRRQLRGLRSLGVRRRPCPFLTESRLSRPWPLGRPAGLGHAKPSDSRHLFGFGQA